MRKSNRKISPVRVGVALTAVSQFVGQPGAISALNGVHGTLVTASIVVGFVTGIIGVFITTLFANESANNKNNHNHKEESYAADDTTTTY